MRLSFISYIIIGLFSLLGCRISHAQMFATIQDCDARYGKAVSPTDLTSDVRFYKKDDLTIKILFVNDKAAVVTFTNAKHSEIKATLLTNLLAGSADGKTWEKIEGEGSPTWQRSDGQAFATYDPKTSELTLFSTDYLEKAKGDTQT